MTARDPARSSLLTHGQVIGITSRTGVRELTLFVCGVSVSVTARRILPALGELPDFVSLTLGRSRILRFSRSNPRMRNTFCTALLYRRAARTPKERIISDLQGLEASWGCLLDNPRKGRWCQKRTGSVVRRRYKLGFRATCAQAVPTNVPTKTTGLHPLERDNWRYPLARDRRLTQRRASRIENGRDSTGHEGSRDHLATFEPATACTPRVASHRCAQS